MSTAYLYAMPPEVQAQLVPRYKLPYVRHEQSVRLEDAFERRKNPNVTDLVLLAAEVGLEPNEVKMWFEHRLACWRQSQGLPANESSVAG